MAKATAQIETRTVVQGVTLTLTEAETYTLLDVLAGVGGSTKDSRRRHCDSIASALNGAGISKHDSPARDGSTWGPNDIEGGIRFSESTY